MADTTTDPVTITDDQLAQLSLQRHEWERLNEEEQSAVLMQIEYGDQSGEEDEDGKVKGDPGAGDDITPPSDVAKAAEEAARLAAEEAAKGKPAAAAPAPAAAVVAGPSDEEQAAEDMRLRAYDYQHTPQPAQAVDTTKLQAEYDTTVTARAEAKKALEAGDLSIADYTDRLIDITEKATALKNQIDRATESANAPHQDALARWNRAQQLFQARPASKAMYADDPIAYALLNAFVQQLAKDQAMVDRGMMNLLFEADKQARARLGVVTAPAKTAAPAPAPASKPAKPAPRHPNTSDVPATLSSVPAADVQQEGDDPYSAIDNLDGPQYTEALAKMSAAQRKAYHDRTNS